MQLVHNSNIHYSHTQAHYISDKIVTNEMVRSAIPDGFLSTHESLIHDTSCYVLAANWIYIIETPMRNLGPDYKGYYN